MWVSKSSWDSEVSFRKRVQEQSYKQFYECVQLRAENSYLRSVLGLMPPPVIEEAETQLREWVEDEG